MEWVLLVIVSQTDLQYFTLKLGQIAKKNCTLEKGKWCPEICGKHLMIYDPQ